jgi:hypothetical protein
MTIGLSLVARTAIPVPMHAAGAFDHDRPEGSVMGTEPEVKSALDDNVRRTVERTALRKVRKLVDVLEEEHTAKSKLEWRALIIASVIGAAFAAWFLLDLISADQKYDRDQKIELPAKVVLPKND